MTAPSSGGCDFVTQSTAVNVAICDVKSVTEMSRHHDAVQPHGITSWRRASLTMSLLWAWVDLTMFLGEKTSCDDSDGVAVVSCDGVSILNVTELLNDDLDPFRPPWNKKLTS